MFIINSITSNIIDITTNMTSNSNVDTNNTNDNDDSNDNNDNSNILDEDKDRYGFFLNDDHHKSLSMSPDINNSRKLKEAERYNNHCKIILILSCSIIYLFLILISNYYYYF